MGMTDTYHFQKHEQADQHDENFQYEPLLGFYSSFFNHNTALIQAFLDHQVKPDSLLSDIVKLLIAGGSEDSGYVGAAMSEQLPDAEEKNRTYLKAIV
jgi:hypothetical protein